MEHLFGLRFLPQNDVVEGNLHGVEQQRYEDGFREDAAIHQVGDLVLQEGLGCLRNRETIIE